jgi:tetratricopeptide (TPR) repeat protein
LKQYSLGIEKHRDVKLAEARSFYENALTVDPSFTAAMASLGMIHYEHFDRIKGKDLLEQAARNVDGLTERERYRILAFYARAVQDDLPQAIRYMQAFIDLYPDDCAGHHNLGWFHTQAAKYDEAINYYQQAIRVDPSFMYSYDNLNRLYLYQLGEVSRAVDLCRRQLARNPERYSAYDNLGWAYVGQGELDKARVAFEKAVELNPKSTLDLYRLAHVLRLQKQYPKAVEVLRRITLVDPKSRIDYDLGLLHGRMGNTDESRRYFLKHRAAVQADLHASPSDMENRMILAKVNARLGRNTELPIPESEDPELHFLAANFHAVRKDPKQVIRHVEAALQRGWTNYVWLQLHPDMEEVKDDPEFQSLLRRLLR